jgi:MFS family permease
MMVAVAIPWFALETTGSAAGVGLTAAAIGVGTALAAVLCGTLVDRLNFRGASVLADLARACYELGRKPHINADSTVALIPLRSPFPAFLRRFQSSS